MKTLRVTLFLSLIIGLLWGIILYLLTMKLLYALLIGFGIFATFVMLLAMLAIGKRLDQLQEELFKKFFKSP